MRLDCLVQGARIGRLSPIVRTVPVPGNRLRSGKETTERIPLEEQEVTRPKSATVEP